MSLLVSIDPGVVCTGWALWTSDRPAGWTLVRCGLSVRPENLKRAPLAHVCAFHAANVRASTSTGLDYIVVEQQQLSTGRDSKAPIAKGNDLLAVQAVGMWVAGRLGGGELIYPTVSDWLANTNAEQTANRLLGALTNDELKVLTAGQSGKKTLDHNVKDAVALGLWVTDRYRSGHRLPPKLSLCA